MNYNRAYKLAVNLLSSLPNDLYYHNVDHTMAVLQACERIYSDENQSDEFQLALLKTAALFHDIGYLVQYHRNEEEACKIVESSLPECDYTRDEIIIINRLIMATQMPQQPRDLLEKIICDADLEYLGTTDFDNISDKLFRELQQRDLVSNKLDWDKTQIEFLSAHQYWTLSAQQRCGEIKGLNLNKVIQRQT
ncbi:MAG TPA: HD domain-containing protein [Bacteroidia bacterium]|nr:HD domain-containing protein [Bacteroidia bacterium]HNT80902.1 HD domain-containing protein [Bacteroidia bacterium]